MNFKTQLVWVGSKADENNPHVWLVLNGHLGPGTSIDSSLKIVDQ